MLALLEGRDLMGERKHFARPSNAAGLSMKLSEESLEEFDAPSLKHPDNSKSDSLPFKKKGYQTAQLQLGPACSVRICSTAGLDGDHHRYHLYVRTSALVQALHCVTMEMGRSPCRLSIYRR